MKQFNIKFIIATIAILFLASAAADASWSHSGSNSSHTDRCGGRHHRE